MGAMVTPGYDRSVQEWRAQMDAELRGEGGLLTLVGTYWLSEGVNTLGSSPDCDIPLPKRAPRLLGAVRMEGGVTTLELDLGQAADLDGAPIHSSARWASQEQTAGGVVTCSDLRMVLVRGSGGIGVRLWDNLKGREMPPRIWFEVDEKYRLQAEYSAYPAPLKVQLPNERGASESGYVQGYIGFKLGGRTHNLDAAETDDGRLYLQFADPTNGVSTYPFGRYLRTEPVLEDGLVYLDFNRSYNPPSAFQPGEPCTFAPKGNHLKIPIEAGERYKAKA